MTDATYGKTSSIPKHLWIIGIIALLWNAMGAYDYVMTETKNASYLSKFTPEQLDYYDNFPTWAVGTWALAVWGGVLGAVLLLLRKRLAVTVLLVSLLAMVATTIYSYGISNGMEVMDDPFALAFSCLIFVVAVVLYFYARAMQKRGVLN